MEIVAPSLTLDLMSSLVMQDVVDTDEPITAIMTNSDISVRLVCDRVFEDLAVICFFPSHYPHASPCC